ncbi:hypothetical protein DM860_009202 [Cuscuta australis]|uniref:Pentacotripeptide-repeat region of PRORP domain-containing protein n=1 Tax=Cuscuta australis TaxID=267555 RepID=A0A328DAE0_9ASTE|nr:hypothetical protein DM860_009202 [Cuscuta australis]
MKPRRSLWAQIIRPARPKIYVKSNLNNWVKDVKKKAPAGDLQRILLKLRNDRRFFEALQVCEWMRKKGIYKFSSSDYVVHFSLIFKVRGSCAAERYAKNLPKQARNDKTYGEVIGCYVHEHSQRAGIWLSPLLHLQRMKELGFALSPRPFNEIMRIQGKPKEVLEGWAEMKKSGVSPDNDSYRIRISSFGLNYDVDGMERMLREMESQPHIVMDWCTYAVVAEFYDREFLVDKAANALEKARTLLKLGEFDEAMKFVKKWEGISNYCMDPVDPISIPYTIIEECIKSGKFREAFNKIQAWSRIGGEKVDVDKLSRLLCKEYLRVGDVFQAFKCFWWGVTRHASQQVHPILPTLFFKYLEECGAFFPLRCTPFLQVNPIPCLAVQHDNSTQPLNMDYENIIKTLVELGELNEARKMVTEWEASDNRRSSSCDNLNIPKLIIEGYCKKCFFLKAEEMAEAWTREKRGQVAEIWFVLASHYQLHGKMVRGLECMRRCFNLTPGLKGNYNMMCWTFMNGIQYSRGTMMMMNGIQYSRDMISEY